MKNKQNIAYIETEKLIIRPWRNESRDLIDLYTYASVPGVGESAGWNHHMSLEHSQAILDGFCRNDENYAIELKSSKRVIGSISLRRTNYSPKILVFYSRGREIGYVLSKYYWNNGYMTEAVKGMLGFAFDVLNLDFVSGRCRKNNYASRRVLEKSGFSFEQNILINSVDGELSDGFLMLYTKSEWLANQLS